MKRFYIYIFCFLFSVPGWSQTRTQQRIAVGDNYFNNEQFHQAISVYQRILRREKQADAKREISFKLGESYRRLLNYSEAKKWYTIALNLGYDNPMVYLQLSDMTLGLEEFDLSLTYIEQYLHLVPNDPRGLKLKQSAQFARENYSTETIFEVSNEKRLNNQGQQWGAGFLENVAIMYTDQAKVDAQFDIDIRLRYNNVFYWVWMSRTLKERIVFSSTQPFVGTSDGYSNIYQATFNRRLGDWDMPQLLKGDINSDYYDGFLSYDKQNDIAYFMNSGGATGNRKSADIYTSKYNSQNDTWAAPTMFPFNSDDFNTGYPSISEDGNTLYFASDMPGGYGGYDIYVIKKDIEGSWGEPKNLGPAINTAFNDSYPFIAGGVLYFSSYGHPGFGGFDVFYSLVKENDEFANPINMGVPVNSSADDFGFIIDDSYTRGFLSSNRPGGSGEDDLFSFRVVPKTFTAQGRVTDMISGEPVGGIELFFYDDKNNFFSTTTNRDGFYNLPELSTDMNYYITAYPDGYVELADTLAVRDQLLANRFKVIRDFEKNLTLIPADLMAAQTSANGKQTSGLPDLSKPEDIITENLLNGQQIVVEKPKTEQPAIVEKPVEVVIPKVDTPLTPSFNLNADGFPMIYFEFGKSELTPTALAQLDVVINYMRANPGRGLIVHAHTDVISGYLFNLFLSQQRAQSILNHLKSKNIDPVRIYPRGYGKTQLAITDARTEEEHAKNRRAHFESIPIEQLQAYLNIASRHSFRYLNSPQKEAYFATGIEFMVQFIASNVPINPQYYKKIMDNLPDVDIIYYYDNDRYHRYLVGSFKDFNAAFEMQRTLRQLGYEIYVVAFNNGERIPVSRARRLAGEL